MRISDWSSDVCSSDLLEDDLHVLAPGPHRLGVERRQFLAGPDGAPAGRLDEPQNGAAESRLAAAGLADDAEGPAGLQRAADGVDRLQGPVAAGEAAAAAPVELTLPVAPHTQRRAHAGAPPLRADA